MRFALRLLLILAVLGASVLLYAITFGEPDGNAHPYVGTLLYERADGFYSCTGTLLNPTLMLSAGHCVEAGGQTNLNTWVSFAPAISFPPLGSVAALRAFLDNPANGWIKASEVIPHPQFNDYAQFPRTYDVGLVRLAAPATHTSVFGALPSEGFLEGIARKRNQRDNRFIAVGYGMQGVIRPFYQDTWARYRGTVKLAEISSFFNGGQSAKFLNNPGQNGGTCFGDSGGPVFYGDTNMITAVVSFGFTPCIGVDYQFRMDTQVALDFVEQYLP
ncbi:MAG: trypsin-like serine protease [Bryobacteraceae bacterium]|nr:trypsin-like serine protease [Bryobacteraceae bacterium]